jgi:hypothetical protein
MPVRKAADKWLSLGENCVPTSARRQADDLELDFLRHGSAPFGYFVRGPGVLGTAPKIDWVGLGVETGHENSARECDVDMIRWY